MNDATGSAREALQIADESGLIHDPRLSAPEALALFSADGTELAQRGRGAIRIVDSALGRIVIRRYRRGGLIAKFSRDWFVWNGADATRPLREFRITRQLHAAGLPVPEAVAARFVRSGPGYRADFATIEITGARTLQEMLANSATSARVDWTAFGLVVAGLHRQGVWHADLNAHNVLFDVQDRIVLIDFDRARVIGSHSRQLLGNLDRLARSLRKLGHGKLVDGAPWQAFRNAYRSESLPTAPRR